jgi:hypothetical protein
MAQILLLGKVAALLLSFLPQTNSSKTIHLRSMRVDGSRLYPSTWQAEQMEPRGHFTTYGLEALLYEHEYHYSHRL